MERIHFLFQPTDIEYPFLVSMESTFPLSTDRHFVHGNQSWCSRTTLFGVCLRLFFVDLRPLRWFWAHLFSLQLDAIWFQGWSFWDSWDIQWVLAVLPINRIFCPFPEVMWLSLRLFKDPLAQFDWLLIIDLALGLSCEGSYVNISTIKAVSYKRSGINSLVVSMLSKDISNACLFIFSFIRHNQGSNLTEMLVQWFFAQTF